ncbi:nascent polypeptide-associated complex subunit alpha, muscle-specific form-like [Eriocheir sinensis]|uniref:nascent polypeptide-associated complex subunit alpha, muscle-specific form-like n=1 Tax=Eriocheir sinensis TaxID=95602 RepID=UPI0021C66D0D|nr:nascent polypeptide-associated complex subunit alpha, muscle-specific form-like [Eriocheir sinensis]
MESRWKVAGVAMVVTAVLAAGAAAQNQLSHTSLAVSLPLGDLAAAASSGQQNTPSEADSVGDFLEQHRLAASPEDASNELLRITPVKLTQEGTVEVLNEAPENPAKLVNSEAGEHFFIVVNDFTADTVNNAPPASEGPQADIHIPDDGAEAPTSAVAEVQDAEIIHSEEDPLSTQHSSRIVNDIDQNISSPDDDAEITDPSVVSGERGAKAITSIAPADAEVFQHPLAEDSVLQVEQSFDIISEVFTESTPASTLPIEAQFQDLSLRTNEAPPTTETPVTAPLSDIGMDDVLPTDSSATDSQASSEISLEQTPDAVPDKISAEEQTPEPFPPEIFVQETSPAPIPVRISLDEPAPDTVLAKLSVEEATLSQVPHEIPEVTAHDGARESHDVKAPKTQLETGSAEVELPSFSNTDESLESPDPIHPPSDINNPGSVSTEAAQEAFVQQPVTSKAARLVELTPTVQLPSPGNQDELNEAAALAAVGATAAVSSSEPQLEVGRVSFDEVLFVQDLPQGTGRAPEDTLDPFAPQIENFDPNAPIDDKMLADVREWIAEDSISGEPFNHSDVIVLPDLPMEDIEIFFLAEDPQANDSPATEVQGVGVTKVKQQLQKDEVHIAALHDAIPFSPGDVQITPQVHEAVKDALEAEIAAMGAFGTKVPDAATAPIIPPAPAPATITFPAPAPAPTHFSGATPAPGPPQAFEIDTTFDPASEQISKPGPAHAPTPVTSPVPKPPQEPITQPTLGQVQGPISHEVPQQNLQPAPAKIQRPAAPPPAPAYDTAPAPAPVPQPTEPLAPAPPITHRPPSTSQTYRPRPKPTRPGPKPTQPRPKPAHPAYQPQPEPTRPPYQKRPRPTRPPYRPTKPTTPSTYPPSTPSPPQEYKPGRPPISYVHVGEPTPEHFKPPSYHGPVPQLPTSYDDFSSPPRHPPRRPPPSPPPRPAPPPPSYKPPSSSYRPPSPTSYKPPSSSSYKPPSPTYTHRRPPSYKPRPPITHPPAVPSSPQYRPPPRHKPPSHTLQYAKPPATTPKPQYRPPPATHKPHKTPKPILAPVLVPAHLSSLVFPKGVTFSGHHKPRPPSLFHLPSFFRTERKQRLQVPASVVSRLDSYQPDWVADLEPERR